jgi:tetratricopeptide (TPR) repeat protein
MLRMMETINKELLPALENRSEPAFEITCKTCHRATARPRILSQEMLLAAHEDGAQGAIDKFNELREDYDNTGTYDFREWETNTVAERLAEDGMHEDAITIYRMNLERFPESASIWAGIGESYEALEDIPAAIEALEKVVELAPRWTAMKDHLAELKGE